MHALVLHAVGGLPIKFKPASGDDRACPSIRITVTRGKIHFSGGPQGAVVPAKFSWPPDTETSAFVALPGQAGQPYCFEYCLASRFGTQLYTRLFCQRGDQLRGRLWRRQRREYLANLKATLSYATIRRHRAVEDARWKEIRSGAGAIDDRIVLEAERCTSTSDIVVLESGRGRLRKTLNERGQAPPEICDCSIAHDQSDAAGNPCPAKHNGRPSIAKKATTIPVSNAMKMFAQIPNSDAAKTAADGKEIMSKTCDFCKKIKAPPSGKKLGLRLEGTQKVIKYIPLSDPAGFNTAHRQTSTDAVESRESPLDSDEDDDSVAAASEAAKSALSEDQEDDGEYNDGMSPDPDEDSTLVEDAAGEDGMDADQETSANAQEQSTAVQDTVLPAPFDEQGESSVTAQEQSAVTQDATTPTPDNAQSAGPETADAPGPRAVSSPPDLRKRAGDCSLEEPPAKRLSVTSSSTARDEDDEEVDPPKPVIKVEESEIIAIEDDSGDEVSHKAKREQKVGGNSIKKARLQHRLRILAIEREEQRIAKETLQAEHELAALERLETVKQETVIKIED
ncbi:unnamed protein product [Zymoseptoria tritici ST99CH_1A5]|uniref:Uncharacterized protein n=2 Tax=Zymoseptoria tritici TaxID=1047171 RepID=A0A1X7S4L1_ZYMT9|nr:unnamed protein product [Zymoseptoria tritici ST99CH_3D7]SMY28228.1 unnamed protein product [Zymoseptoria tritici ST99CH_1A5]